MSLWHALLWPLLKEIIASIRQHKYFQEQRETRGLILKTALVLLLITIVAVGDMALEAHAELLKLRKEKEAAREAVDRVEVRPGLRDDYLLQFSTCMADKDMLRLKLDYANSRIAHLETNLPKTNTATPVPIPHKPEEDRRKQAIDRLERLRREGN